MSGSPQFAAPDEAAAVSQLSQEREVAFPRGLVTDRPHNIAGQPILMHANGAQPGRAIVEQLLLPRLAAVSFIDHDCDSHLTGGVNDLLNQLAHLGLE